MTGLWNKKMTQYLSEIVEYLFENSEVFDLNLMKIIQKVTGTCN